MDQTIFPVHLKDKIFEIRYDSDLVSNIISYFPFSESEKQEICNVLNMDTFDGFHTIFTDSVSNDEWNKTEKIIGHQKR